MTRARARPGRRSFARSPWTSVRLAMAVGLSLTALVVIGPTDDVDATSIVPFAPRFATNDNGSIAVFGNNLMVCPATAAGCEGARSGTNSQNNNGFNMVHLDIDGASFPTFSSSAANVTLPADAAVRWAGLYWGARLGAGRGGVAASGDGREMKLRVPGDADYRPIAADQLFGPSATADRAYQSFADVTSVVRTAGAGTYTGADVPAATGEDRYAGWSLVVVYAAPSLPLRNLTVFDGLADVGRNDPQVITISGFRTPVTGPVNARVGLIAYEGDRGSSGDRAILRDPSSPDGTLLSTSLSPATNFFNGTNDDNGNLVTARTPADVNMLGFDIKNFDAPGVLGNSSSSAQIDLASTNERYFPGVVTTAIDVFAPDFSPSTKSVTNLDGSAPARPGDRLRYTVTFVNGGQDPAVNTEIVDEVPTGTRFVPGSLDLPAGVTGSYDAATDAIRLQPGDFPVGRSVRFAFDVEVDAAAAGTTISNQATIDFDGATVEELRDLSFTTRAASIAVQASADLSITKVNSPDPVVAGETLTSLIGVTNAGPNAAEAVVVTDALPIGLGAVVATSTQGTCAVDAALVTCAVGTVTVGATVTVTVTAEVVSTSTAASLTDVARVTSTTSDPDGDDTIASAAAAVVRNADLSVTKTVEPAVVAPGGAVTYTITATNAGPSTATDVALTDTITSSGIVLTSATSLPSGVCTTGPASARCTIASLAPGATAVMTVEATSLPSAIPATVVDNSAVASSSTPDADSSDNVADASVTIGAAASTLEVSKDVVAPEPLVAGVGEVAYTIGVRNSGPSDADPVTVTDVVPAGFVVRSATTSRGSCTVSPAPTGDGVACDLGRLVAPFGSQAGATATVTIVAAVDAGVAAGEYVNVARISSPSTPPIETGAAAVTVATRADLSVVKSFPAGADAEITPGTVETYRIRVVNDGPSVARDVVVTDTLPNGLSAVAWRTTAPIPTPAPTCDVATASCTVGELAPRGFVEFELDVAVDPGLVIDPDVGVVNTVEVGSATADPNPGNDRSLFTASGESQADLSIRKLPPSPDRTVFPVDRPVAGLTTSYILEIINFGPSVAPEPVFADVLPSGMSFVRVFDPTAPDVVFPDDFCVGDGLDPETITCRLPVDFPASVGTNLGIEVAIDPTVADGTVLSNTVTISSAATDNNPGNNASSADLTVRAEVNLRVRKLMAEYDAAGIPIREVPYPDALQMPAGYAVGFILDVVNEGPSAAAGVTVYDAFEPPSATFQTVDCDFLNGEVVCPYENSATGNLLLPGQSFQPQLLFLPEGDTPVGGYLNRARVSSVTAETDLADNADQRTVEIVEPIADVIVEKTALTSPLVAGDTFSYQVAVSAGRIDLATAVLRLSSDAEDVVVTDILPDGLVPDAVTTSQGTCVVAGQGVTCDLGTVGSTVDPARPSPPVLLTITGRVAASFAATEVTNTAVATTSTALLGGGGQVRASVTTPVERSAALSVTKRAVTTSAPAGSSSRFEVAITNAGPSDSRDVVVTDALPTPVEFDAAGSDARCAPEAGAVVCRLDAVPVGSTTTLTIAASIPPGAAVGALTNTVTVSSATPDPDPAADRAEATVTVTREADLSVTKTSSSAAVLLGDSVSYAVGVTNNGPSSASTVVVTEDIPPGTSIVGPLPIGCSGAGPVTCALGDLAAGEVATVEFILDIAETVPLGALTNMVSVTSETDDPEPDNDNALSTVEVIALADVVLDKTLVTSPAVAGEPLVYELTLTNRGPTVAPNPSVTDPLPIGTSYVSLTAPGGQCQLDDDEGVPAASCSLAALAVGASVTATLIVDTDVNLVSVQNTAFGGSGGLDQTPADNEDTVDTELWRVADLSVSKTGPVTVAAGSTAAYTITYRNDGPATAPDVEVTDTLPAGLTAADVPGCSVVGQLVTCQVGSLVAGAVGSISVPTRVDPNLVGGVALVNRASIRTTDGGVLDPGASNDVASAASAVSEPPTDPVPPSPGVGEPVVPVAPAPGQPGGSLPSTGTTITDVVVLAVTLVALGALFGLLSTTRRRHVVVPGARAHR